MARRKTVRKRKAPARSARPASRLWWVFGAVVIGWVAFDQNRAWVNAVAPDLSPIVARLGLGEPERSAALAPRSSQPGPARIEQPARPTTPPQAPAASRTPERPMPPEPVGSQRREARSEAVRSAAATPTRRPVAAPPAALAGTAPSTRETRPPAAGARTVTARPAPLRRAPEASAPVWLTIEAGQPVRITQRKGEWRLVEAGIFTGWMPATMIETRSVTRAVPQLARAAREADAAPVPPGAIPTAMRR